MKLLQYLWWCYRAYRCPSNRLAYTALTRRGVPFLTVIVARDREAWRVSQWAIETMERIV